MVFDFTIVLRAVERIERTIDTLVLKIPACLDKKHFTLADDLHAYIILL